MSLASRILSPVKVIFAVSYSRMLIGIAREEFLVLVSRDDQSTEKTFTSAYLLQLDRMTTGGKVKAGKRRASEKETKLELNSLLLIR